jgi:hypothetical protein
MAIEAFSLALASSTSSSSSSATKTTNFGSSQNFDVGPDGKRRYPALRQPFDANPMTPEQAFRQSARARAQSRQERKHAFTLSQAAANAASGFVQ